MQLFGCANIFCFFVFTVIMVTIFNSKKMLNYEGETYSGGDFGFLLP